MGFQYDSNANLGPVSNDLNLGGWLVKVNDAKAKGSLGAYLGAEVDLGKRFYRDSPWWLVGDGQVFWRGHANSSLHDTHTQELQWGRVAAGLRHLTSSTLAEVRMKTEIIDYEFYQNVKSYGAEGTLLWAANPALHLLFKGGLEQRDYSKDHQRDGLTGTAGLYGRIFFGESNHELLFGGRYFWLNADKHDYSYDGWEGTARMLFKLPHGFELAPFVSYMQGFYKGPGTALETEDRRDKRFKVGLGLTYRINESWSLELGYQYIHNYSNSALYKYEQHLVNTGIVWSF